MTAPPTATATRATTTISRNWDVHQRHQALRLVWEADESELAHRVGNLESDMGAVKAGLGRIESAVVTLTARFDAAIPHLSTRADIVRIEEQIKHKPSQGFVITMVAAIVGLVIGGIALAPYLRDGIGG